MGNLSRVISPFSQRALICSFLDKHHTPTPLVSSTLPEEVFIRTLNLFPLNIYWSRPVPKHRNVLLSKLTLTRPSLFVPRHIPLKFPNLPKGCGLPDRTLCIQSRVILHLLCRLAPAIANEMMSRPRPPLATWTPRFEQLKAAHERLNLKGKRGLTFPRLHLWQLANTFLAQHIPPLP